MKGKYLITTDNWFYAPDGKTYRAVWGNVEVIEDSFLGIKTNRNSSNWFVKIGSNDNYVVIAGCQIHYAVRCENEPNSESVEDYLTSADVGVKYLTRPSNIYIAK